MKMELLKRGLQSSFWIPLYLSKGLKRSNACLRNAAKVITPNYTAPSLRIIDTFVTNNRHNLIVQVRGTRATFKISVRDLALRKELLVSFDVSDISYIIWTAKEEYDANRAYKIQKHKTIKNNCHESQEPI